MLSIIQLLVFGHTHNWETIEICDVVEDREGEYPIGKNIYMRCVKCGDHKIRKLR